jgi:putative addiction module killer protein
MRIDYGQGYRLYYTIRGQELLLLLVGGDKGSQRADIARAQDMVKELNKK